MLAVRLSVGSACSFSRFARRCILPPAEKNALLPRRAASRPQARAAPKPAPPLVRAKKNAA